MEINYAAILPEIILSLTGILVMLLVPSVRKDGQKRLGWLSVGGIAAALAAAGWQLGTSSGAAFSGMIVQDEFGTVTRLLLLLVSGLIAASAIPYLRREGILQGEFFCLLLFATVGMCFMASSSDLIMTFLGLETLSIATYVLAGMRQKADVKSAESAWKYFILGAFSTSFMLYGIAFLYGQAGSTRYPEIAAFISQGTFDGTLYLGVGLLLVGFGFKVAMAPFHVWAPDVYQGAPLPVTSHLAVGSKAAAFIALLRIFQQVTPEINEYWVDALWMGAVLTMAIGNVAAISQRNLKRLLAYSSVAHAGYILVGVAAHNQLGAQGILYYLSAYALMTIGAFVIIQVISLKGEAGIDLEDFKGIGFKAPFLTLSLSIFLISMAGIPATAGFMGKFFLFSAAIQQQLYWLVVIAVITSAIGLYYYLRVIVVMFMQEGSSQPLSVELTTSLRAIILLLVLGTLFLGLYPAPLLELANGAVQF
ncbi:MAG TPA: NADH-quinone oxidoreductase subunit N [Acidobacteriota bacterium]|nr:NADH-quinone oxidoreductase subunit N [Acidobacteriota bacterium]